MKRVSVFATVALSAAFLVSCGDGGNAETANHDNHDHDTSDEKTEQMAETKTVMVDTENSMVMWEGNMTGAKTYNHFGNLMVSEGKLEMTGDAISGGGFVIDMTSITPKDSNYSEELPVSDLVGHLTSADFFDVENHPTAEFSITGYDAEAHTVTGMLNIRGNSNEETISDVMIDKESGKISGTLTFDRQKYDVAWSHPLKDMFLSDNIKVEVSLMTKEG